MFPAADNYDIDLSVDEAAVDALLSVTPRRCRGSRRTHLLAERLPAADDRLPVHL